MRPSDFPRHKCCETCLYWDDHGDDEDAKPRTGECARFPPVFVGLDEADSAFDHQAWQHPVTGGHWACGEYVESSNVD